jgi:hypothetical protein
LHLEEVGLVAAMQARGKRPYFSPATSSALEKRLKGHAWPQASLPKGFQNWCSSGNVDYVLPDSVISSSQFFLYWEEIAALLCKRAVCF